MKMHLLNPVTTREMTAQKLEDSPDAPGEVESSDRWLTLAVSSLITHAAGQIAICVICNLLKQF